MQQGQKFKDCSKPNLQWRRNGPSRTILLDTSNFYKKRTSTAREKKTTYQHQQVFFTRGITLSFIVFKLRLSMVVSEMRRASLPCRTLGNALLSSGEVVLEAMFKLRRSCYTRQLGKNAVPRSTAWHRIREGSWTATCNNIWFSLASRIIEVCMHKYIYI